ncbi:MULTISPECIES: ArsR/SmtB family transcription factor [unclassified Cupriavidus]|uniref:ArsR/SmtB family transcription factor n=1 Tax=Cupriavidus sp. H19C3 TaxID=3241603 RepID=UPI003BF7EBCC
MDRATHPAVDIARAPSIFNHMVEYANDARLTSIFQALASDTRRSMLMRLLQGELPVTELARPLAMSLNAVSKHIKVLEAAGLVRRRTEGVYAYLSLNPETLAEAERWMAFYRPYWEARLDALAAELSQDDPSPESS